MSNPFKIVITGNIHVDNVDKLERFARDAAQTCAMDAEAGDVSVRIFACGGSWDVPTTPLAGELPPLGEPTIAPRDLAPGEVLAEGDLPPVAAEPIAAPGEAG